MASSTPSPLPQPTDAPVIVQDSSLGPRLVLGAFLSAIVPGIGHLLVNRWKNGCVFLGIAIMVLALNWSLRPALHAWAFGLTAVGTFALSVFSAWEVGYSAPAAHGRLSSGGWYFSFPPPWREPLLNSIWDYSLLAPVLTRWLLNPCSLLSRRVTI